MPQLSDVMPIIHQSNNLLSLSLIGRRQPLKTSFLAGSVLIGVMASTTLAQTITSQADNIAADKAEITSLGEEAHGDVYSLPHDKLMRVATLSLKYFIQDNFVDPDSVQAVIMSDPRHVDLNVWQGLLGGGHVKVSGMAVCARINGKNRLGGYTGDKQFLVVFMDSGKYRFFSSPNYNEITRTTEINSTVTSTCAS